MPAPPPPFSLTLPAKIVARPINFLAEAKHLRRRVRVPELQRTRGAEIGWAKLGIGVRVWRDTENGVFGRRESVEILTAKIVEILTVKIVRYRR
ncbi:hypothetical protein ACFX2B_003573 [Malus domestica]